MTTHDFRKIALSIPGAVEQSHMEHPDFRLKGKIFASLGSPDGHHGMVKLTPEQQGEFVKKAPAVFTPCNGAWGRQGCTYVLLEGVTPAILRAAISAAAKNIGRRAGGPSPAARAK